MNDALSRSDLIGLQIVHQIVNHTDMTCGNVDGEGMGNTVTVYTEDDIDVIVTINDRYISVDTDHLGSEFETPQHLTTAHCSRRAMDLLFEMIEKEREFVDGW